MKLKGKEIVTLKWYLSIALFLVTNFNTRSQENYIVKQQDQSFINELFDQKLYAHLPSSVMQEMIDLELPPYINTSKQYKTNQLLKGISTLRIEDPASYNELTDNIKAYYPDPVTIPAILEIGSYEYYQRNYNSAIVWYDKVDLSDLPRLDHSEAAFKKGYCLFVTKSFAKAERILTPVSDEHNVFYYPVNYYLGMCQYFNNQLDQAINSFKKVASSEYYGDYMPYILSQIYFAQDKQDLLISYAEQRINEPNTRNKREIRLLLGQTYYKRKDYDRALNHLEFYEANSDKLTKEQFYQLAFTQYQKGKYAKAADNFLELTYLDSKIGQVSNYYLADCYIKLDERDKARAIFKKVSQMDYEPSMKEEAIFNYAKLSAEQNADREAISILVDIKPSSPYYDESQDIIYDLLNNSPDYQNSIQILESLSSLNEKLKIIYQALSLKKSIQLYHDYDYKNAKTYLDKSLKYTPDRFYTAQTYYWQAKLKYSEQDYLAALDLLNKYKEISNGLNDLPDEAAQYSASYLQAYCMLKQHNYREAELAFKNAIVGINLNTESIDNEYILKRMQPDAYVRLGDCLFKQRKYEEAIGFYDKMAERRQPGYLYSIYQKGIILGLLEKPYEKIQVMEEIVKDNPKSEYADDAHMQMGDTYLQLGNPEAAVVPYVDLLAKFGSSSIYFKPAKLKLGLINYNRGNIEQALTYYKEVLVDKPTASQKKEALTATQEIYVKNLGQPNEFFEFAEQLDGVNLDDFERDSLSYVSAFNLYNEGRFDDAIASYSSYLNQYPNGFYKYTAHYQRAEIFVFKKNYLSALEDYEVLINEQANIDRNKVIRNAALIAYDQQLYDKALRYYRIYEGLLDNEAEKQKAQVRAMNSAYKSKANDDLVVFANKVNNNVLSTIEERATSLYYIGKSSCENDNWDQALAAFEQVSKMVNNAQAAEARYLSSMIFYQQGKKELAEKQANFTNETSINHPFWVAKSIILLSDIYLDRNDLINARAALEAVKENFGQDLVLLTIVNEKIKVLEQKEADANRIMNTSTDKIELDTTGSNN